MRDRRSYSGRDFEYFAHWDRQSGATPNHDFSIGQLRVATTFDEVLIGPAPTIPSLTWYGDGLTAGGSGTWSTAGSNSSDNGGAAPTYNSPTASVNDVIRLTGVAAA